MADKSISELVSASEITPTDLFVLEQNNTAKKLTGQILENWLVSYADGHGGIQSIAKTKTVGLVDTYTITYADTSTNTFTVTNGEKGDTGSASYIWIKYSGVNPTKDSDMGNTPDKWIGVYSGTQSDVTALHYTDYKWYLIKGAQGDIGTPAQLTSSEIRYGVSSSPSVQPSSWSESIPTVVGGQCLWTRTVLTFNSGSPITTYTVSKWGVDGTGTGTVTGNRIGESGGVIQPDSNGIVTLPVDDEPTENSGNFVTSGTVKTAIDNTQGLFFLMVLKSTDWTQVGDVYEQTLTSPYFFSSGYSYIASPDAPTRKRWTDADVYARNILTNGSCTFVATNEPSTEGNITVGITRVRAL